MQLTFSPGAGFSICKTTQGYGSEYYLFWSFFFWLLRPTLTEYRGSQARGPIEATVAGLPHSHSNIKTKLSLQPTPQLTATLDP